MTVKNDCVCSKGCSFRKKFLRKIRIFSIEAFWKYPTTIKRTLSCSLYLGARSGDCACAWLCVRLNHLVSRLIDKLVLNGTKLNWFSTVDHFAWRHKIDDNDNLNGLSNINNNIFTFKSSNLISIFELSNDLKNG